MTTETTNTLPTIPVTVERECNACSNKWRQSAVSPVRNCPKCQGYSAIHALQLHSLNSRMEVAHNAILSTLLSRFDEEVLEWNYPASPDVPVWKITAVEIIDAITESPDDISIHREGLSVIPATSSRPFDRIEVWIKTSCSYHDTRETDIACHVRADRECLVGWDRELACGGGMTHIIGEYCACLSALSWASQTASLVGHLDADSELPEVVIHSDNKVIVDQIWGSNSVNEESLQPLHRSACALAKWCDATGQWTDGNENPAGIYLPNR